MPNFSPNGLQYSRSLSNTSPMTNGTEAFLWDSHFHGFSGDLAVGNISTNVPDDDNDPVTFWLGLDLTSSANTSNLNPIFPCPVTANIYGQQNATFPIGVSPIGVLSTWTYTPLGAKEPITVNNYKAGTPIEPGTFITANVIVDPLGVFTVQSATGWGVSANMTRNFVSYAAKTVYEVTSFDNNTTPVSWTFSFPLGNFSGANAGSVACISYSEVASANDLYISRPTDQAGSIGTPLSTIGLAKGLGASDDNLLTVFNGTTYPNVYMDVVLANQYFTAGISSSGRYTGLAQI